MHINKNIAISETGFVFNPLTGDSFSTNQVGQEILRKLQGGISQEDLLKHITQKFSVDKTTLEKDMTDFMLMLGSYEILMNDEKA
ncbi:MAG: PqqD family protein [Bacteroidia bacterium]